MGRSPRCPSWFVLLAWVLSTVPTSGFADTRRVSPSGDAGVDVTTGPGAAPVDAPPAVRVIHVHAEPPAIQALYGYHADQDKADIHVSDGARGARRFERMVETRTGPDRGYTELAGAMNHTVVATLGATGELTQACLHGAAEDIATHLHPPLDLAPPAKSPPALPPPDQGGGE